MDILVQSSLSCTLVWCLVYIEKCAHHLDSASCEEDSLHEIPGLLMSSHRSARSELKSNIYIHRKQRSK